MFFRRLFQTMIYDYEKNCDLFSVPEPLNEVNASVTDLKTTCSLFEVQLLIFPGFMNQRKLTTFQNVD